MTETAMEAAVAEPEAEVEEPFEAFYGPGYLPGGEPPLYVAPKKGKTLDEVEKYLEGQGWEVPKTRGGPAPLSRIILDGTEYYPPEGERKHPDRWSNDYFKDRLPEELFLLEEACVSGDYAKVEELIKQGTDVNAPIDMDYNTALMIACRQGDWELAELLVKLGADLDGPLSRGGLRAIDIAASCGFHFPSDVQLAEFLKSKGSQYTWWGAAYGADVHRLAEYLDNGQDINEINPALYNCNAVDLASGQGHDRISQWLMAQGGLMMVRPERPAECVEDLWELGRQSTYYYKDDPVMPPIGGDEE